MMPLVFTPTTLGKQLNFGLTCRGAAIGPEASAELAGMFLNRLEWFASADDAVLCGAELFRPSIRVAGA